MRALAICLAPFTMACAIPAHADDATTHAVADTRPAATVAELDWLLGQWEGVGISGHPAGEAFSYAGSDQMVGYFWQLDEAGGVLFYELITIVPDGESLAMRLKHFNADLTGWEEKPGETALHFPLREKSADKWRFGPVTLERNGANALDITVLMNGGSGNDPYTLDFSYRRVGH